MSHLLRVGIVEDEFITSTFISDVLSKLDCEVLFCVDNGAEALDKIAKLKPNLLFLDINIAGNMDGIALARDLNRRNIDIAHIYITAYNNADTLKEASLTKPQAYLSKPFTHKDIEIVTTLAKVKILNISTKESSSLQISKSLLFDFELQTLYCDDKSVKLTAKETEVLNMLCKKPNGIVSQKEIISKIWNNEIINSSSLRDLIYRLRKKAPEIEIESVASIGYRLRVQ